MSVASMPMPPSRRKPSMPARSVTTWKFTLRSPLTMAKRTIFAISQPAISTISASARRGRKSATCARNRRSGSSITSKRFMRLPAARSCAFQQREEALHRNVNPVRTVRRLIAQLVEHLLDLRELQQAAHVVERFVDTASFHRRGVSLHERLARRLLPSAQRRPQALAAGLAPLAQLGRAVRIAEGAQHAGDVAQRRVLVAAFGEWTRRLALEVDDQEVVVRYEHLAEVVVAVVARLHRLLLRRRAAVDEGEDARALGGHCLRLVAALDNAERLLGLLVHARAPGVDVLRGERLGLERRIAARRGEGAVQLGGARGERLDERQVGRMVLVLAQPLDEALEIRERVAPGIALVHDVRLQQRHGGGLAAAGRQVLDRAGERHAMLETRDLGEEAADLELRMHALPDAAEALEEQAIAKRHRGIGALRVQRAQREARHLVARDACELRRRREAQRTLVHRQVLLVADRLHHMAAERL